MEHDRFFFVDVNTLSNQKSLRLISLFFCHCIRRQRGVEETDYTVLIRSENVFAMVVTSVFRLMRSVVFEKLI